MKTYSCNKFYAVVLLFLNIMMVSCFNAPENSNKDLNKSPNNICVANQTVEEDCTDQQPNSFTATISKLCNDSGTGYAQESKCIISKCAGNYNLIENSCIAQVCAPSQSYPSDSCTGEIANSVTALKSKTCNATGSSFNYGSCTLSSCQAGFYQSGNSCIAQVCTPNQSYPSDSCTGEIANSATALKSKTCNAIGSSFNYGSCTLSSCQAGFYQSGNSCIAQVCTPNQSYSSVSCTGEIANSATALKSKTCNATGSSFNYGSCTLSSCQAGFYQSGNSCIAQVCTPNQSYPSVSCTGEIANSATALKSKTCNVTGSSFNYGSCTLSSCQAGYDKSANTCVLSNYCNINSATQSSGFAGGTGTLSDPYTICNNDQFYKVNTYSSYKYYQLKSDLDFGGLQLSISLFGNFDGNSKTIRNIKTSGIFVMGSTSVVRDLNVNNASVTNRVSWPFYAGTIASELPSGAIVSRCHVFSGTVLSTMFVGSAGGIVGDSAGTIEYSSFDGTVTGTSSASDGPAILGGLAGENSGTIRFSYSGAAILSDSGSIGGLVGANAGTLEDSNFTGTVTGKLGPSYGTAPGTAPWDTGGLVGNNQGIIRRSYSTATVKNLDYNVGGIAGSNSGEISLSYSKGEVINDNGWRINMGGLVGDNHPTGKILDSFSRTKINELGNGNFAAASGGLVGSNAGMIDRSYAVNIFTSFTINKRGLVGETSGNVSSATNSYWDISVSQLTTSPQGLGLTTTQLKALNLGVNWKVDQNLNNGYPVPSWVTSASP